MSQRDAFSEALGGDVAIPVTGLSIYKLRQERFRLKRLLTDVVVAADRMRDGWAEGDEGVKSQLWRALHAAAEAAHEVVYPLPGAVPCADGSLVHEFQGQPTCPACGWAGIEA